MNCYELVKEFMTVGGQPVANEITVLNPDRLKFRMRLINEEINELLDAIFSNDRLEVLDAIIDIKYVFLGKLIEEGNNPKFSSKQMCMIQLNQEPDKLLNLSSLISMLKNPDSECSFFVDFIGYIFGFTDKQMDEAFKRVHDNNMSKFCKSFSEALLTVDDYANQGIETFHEQVGDYYVIYRKSDKKIMKSIQWTPVDLKDLI